LISLKNNRKHIELIDFILSQKGDFLNSIGYSLCNIFSNEDNSELAFEIWQNAFEKLSGQQDKLSNFISCMELVKTLDETTMALAEKLAPLVAENFKDYSWLADLERLAPNNPQKVFDLLKLTYTSRAPFGCNDEVSSIIKVFKDNKMLTEIEELSELFLDKGSRLVYDLKNELNV